MTDRSEWEHLMAYGYAPGSYMNACHVCKQTVVGVDKRAITCRPCAEAKHAALIAAALGVNPSSQPPESAR